MRVNSCPIYQDSNSIRNYFEVLAPVLGYEFKLLKNEVSTQAILIKDKSCVSPIYIVENPILCQEEPNEEVFYKHLKMVKQLNLEMYNWASFQEIDVKLPAWSKITEHYIIDLNKKNYNTGLRQRLKNIPDALQVEQTKLTPEVFAVFQQTAKQKGFYNSKMEQKKFHFIAKSIETESGILFKSKIEENLVSVEFYLHTKKNTASLIFSGDVSTYRKQHLHPKILHLQFEKLMASGFEIVDWGGAIDQGLIEFKQSFGAEVKPLNFYHIPMSLNRKIYHFTRRLFK